MAPERAPAIIEPESTGRSTTEVAALAHTRSPIATTRVGTVMHRGVITCGPDCSGLAVARIMTAHRIHSIVVIPPGAPPRIVTDAEIARALYDGTLATSSAIDIAKSAAILVRDDTLSYAIGCMHEHETTHAVVVDSRRSPRAVGVLSVLNIVEVFPEGGGSWSSQRLR
jgi:CBS domain-containing protein